MPGGRNAGRPECREAGMPGGRNAGRPECREVEKKRCREGGSRQRRDSVGKTKSLLHDDLLCGSGGAVQIFDDVHPG
jgi:hypothetical protein